MKLQNARYYDHAEGKPCYISIEIIVLPLSAFVRAGAFDVKGNEKNGWQKCVLWLQSRIKIVESDKFSREKAFKTHVSSQILSYPSLITGVGKINWPWRLWKKFACRVNEVMLFIQFSPFGLLNLLITSNRLRKTCWNKKFQLFFI